MQKIEFFQIFGRGSGTSKIEKKRIVDFKKRQNNKEKQKIVKNVNTPYQILRNADTGKYEDATKNVSIIRESAVHWKEDLISRRKQLAVQQKSKDNQQQTEGFPRDNAIGQRDTSQNQHRQWTAINKPFQMFIQRSNLSGTIKQHLERCKQSNGCIYWIDKSNRQKKRRDV